MLVRLSGCVLRCRCRPTAIRSSAPFPGSRAPTLLQGACSRADLIDHCRLEALLNLTNFPSTLCRHSCWGILNSPGTLMLLCCARMMPPFAGALPVVGHPIRQNKLLACVNLQRRARPWQRSCSTAQQKQQTSRSWTRHVLWVDGGKCGHENACPVRWCHAGG